MAASSVILVGMPGSGKSTVGVILAKELCYDFIDTDVVIQNREGMNLQDIINQRGLDAFLAVEEAVILSLDPQGTVVAPGGSVVLSDPAMRHLGRFGSIVFIDVPLEILMPRIDVYSRGIVKHPEDTLLDVYKRRWPLYRSYADNIIDCGSMSQVEIARNIAETILLQ